MGNIYSFGQQDQLKYYNRYKLFEPYFQDDWRITNRLTLNLGLRLSLLALIARNRSKPTTSTRPLHWAKRLLIRTTPLISYRQTVELLPFRTCQTVWFSAESRPGCQTVA